MSQIIEFFLQIQQQIKLYHWKTKSYSRHIASGDLYSKLDKMTDEFIEIYQGKLNGSRIEYKKINLTLYSINDRQISDVLKEFKNFLSDDLEIILSENLKNMTNSDLINKRDEILAIINQTLYLFSLA